MIGIVDALYRSSPKAGPSSVPPFLSPPQSLHPTATPVRYRSPGTRIVDGKMENRKSVDRLFRGQLRPESPRRHKKRVSDKIANPYKFWSEREDSNLRHLGPKPIQIRSARPRSPARYLPMRVTSEGTHCLPWRESKRSLFSDNNCAIICWSRWSWFP